jgi:hypothetical protein
MMAIWAALAAILEEQAHVLEGIALDLFASPALARACRRGLRPPISCSMVTNSWIWMPYCHGQRQKWMPGGKVSAWMPASPLRAMISPSGSVLSEPTRTNFLLTMPMVFLGMMTTPKIRRISR